MDPQLGLFPDEPAATQPPVSPADVPERLRAVAGRIPEGLRLGTSSWSFPGWQGIVYQGTSPQRVLARHGLQAYAEHPLLRTVGIDRTYYRPLPAEDFREYADAVPPDFRFLVKADRALTSPTDPESRGVRRDNPRFLDARYATTEVVEPMLQGLGEKAGPLLFQFSPMAPGVVGGTDAFLGRLHDFLKALPRGPLYAVELRTPAFLDDEYVKLMEDVGAAHCYNVHPSMTPLDRQLGKVSPFYQPALVVRWMLHDGLKYEVAKERYEPFHRLVDEDRVSRERIAVAVLDALVAEREAFVIANNKAEGSAPLTVFRLAERIATWSAHPDAAATGDAEGGRDARAS
ncbi:MAG: DUF72 domain-containing protein [Longimicrobiales bacterium]|nr:DUF72 domain-containing protein [Longimicrobiales bacterium]